MPQLTTEQYMERFDQKIAAKQTELLNQFQSSRRSLEGVDIQTLEHGEVRESPKWLPTMGTDKMCSANEMGYIAESAYYRQFSPCFEGTQKKVFEALLSMMEKETEFLRASKETIKAGDMVALENPSYNQAATMTENRLSIPMENATARQNAADSLIRYMAGDHYSDRTLVSSEAYQTASPEEKQQLYCLASMEPLIMKGLEEYGVTSEQVFQCKPTQRQPEQLTFRLPDHPDLNAQTYSEHFEKGATTPQEAKYGEDVFAHTFAPIYHSKAQKDGMKAAGISQYDLIFINGKSVNEMYGNRYGRLTERHKNAMLQTAVVSAAMDGKSRVECCRLQMNGDRYEIAGAITMQPKLELHEPRLSRWSRFKQALRLEPKTIPKAKQLEDLAKTDLKAPSRREQIAAKTEEWIHKLQEKGKYRSKSSVSELSDDRKKERRTEKAVEKTSPDREKSADRGMGR